MPNIRWQAFQQWIYNHKQVDSKLLCFAIILKNQQHLRYSQEQVQTLGLSSDTLIPYQEIVNLKRRNDRGRDRSFFPFQEFIHIHFSGLQGPLLLKKSCHEQFTCQSLWRSPQISSTRVQARINMLFRVSSCSSKEKCTGNNFNQETDNGHLSENNIVRNRR